MLRLQLLGTTRILIADKSIDQDLPIKSQALLIYLAMMGHSHSRLSLAGLLWPEKDEIKARVNLRQALRQLRLSLPDHLQATRESIGLKPNLPWEVDALEFDARARRGLAGDMAQLQMAVDGYGGDFLAGFFAGDAAEFESWMLLERERYRSQALQGLQQLANHYMELGDTGRGIQVTHRLLAMEPWHEASYRRLMRLLAWEGQIGAALAQFETARQILMAELGVEPGPETLALYEEIRTGALQPPSALAVLADQASPRRRPAHNLPRVFTRFVGRQAEAERLSDWLRDPACALITLRGPGGVGKTRLAVEVARHNLAHFPDGAWFVDLAPVSRAEDLFAALAAGLGIEPPTRANIKARVLTYLKERRLLLILDNFEHLMAAKSDLLEILQQAAGVQVLVTSRESLNLSAEWLFQAGGLDLLGDAAGQLPPAMRLFIERVRQWRSGEGPDPPDQKMIARICQLLDGLPLAIELAASLARSLSYEDIAQAIEQDLDVLTTQRSDVSGRHRSLRAVFEYSWQLLSRREQVLLSKLSVFRGEFTILAAGAVTDEPDTLLADLQNKSFLYQSTSGRYQMHELLQQYAGQKALELNTLADARRRHGQFYLAFLRERETAIRDSGACLALTEIRRDLPNMRQAWRWAAELADARALEAGRPTLASFFSLSGLWEEGETLFGLAAAGLGAAAGVSVAVNAEHQPVLTRLLADRASFLDALSRYDEAVDLAREATKQAAACRDAQGLARAFNIWGLALIHRGDYQQAETRLDRALEAAQDGGLNRLEAATLTGKGVARFYLADYPAARGYLDRARTLFRAMGDLAGEGSALNSLAIVYVRMGDYARAVPLYEQALQICRQVGDRGGEILGTANLGITASLQGNFSVADERLLDALAGCREIGERRVESALLNSLGANRLQQADYDQAQERFMEALRLARKIGIQNTESEVLTNLGLLAQWRDDWDRALDYSWQGLGLAEAIGEQAMAGFAWMGIGRAQESMQHFEEAGEAYRQALRIREPTGWRSLITEAQAGLARLSWQQGQEREALSLVETMLSCLSQPDVAPEHSLDGSQEPARVYLTCYHILLSTGDERAQQTLTRAVSLIERRAGQIADPARRRAFLQQIPGHHELLAAAGQVRV